MGFWSMFNFVSIVLKIRAVFYLFILYEIHFNELVLGLLHSSDPFFDKVMQFVLQKLPGASTGIRI